MGLSSYFSIFIYLNQVWKPGLRLGALRRCEALRGKRFLKGFNINILFVNSARSIDAGRLCFDVAGCEPVAAPIEAKLAYAKASVIVNS
jgi:hypothetical protein